MSKKEFVELIEKFCVVAKLPDPQIIVRDNALKVGEVMLSFEHDETIGPDEFVIYTEFGFLPARRELEICMALMESNIYLAANKGPIFSISPDTGKVVLVGRHVIADTTPEKMRDVLADLAGKAAIWRKDYFLGMKPASNNRRGMFASLIDTPKK